MNMFDRLSDDQAVSLLSQFTDEDFQKQARQLFELRAPLEIGNGDRWSACPDDLAAQIYALPADRAAEVAKGVHLSDGRLVRFRMAT